MKTSDLIWQDKQHQQLFAIIDQLRGDEPADVVLVRLSLYMDSHFVLEETYMKELGYPDADEHHRAHDRFREEISSMIDENDGHDPLHRDALSTYLTQWLKLHVMGIDKALEAYILEHQRK